MTDVTVWDGSTDDDWTDATNWSNGVPSSSKIASIPASLSTYPDLASDCTVHALELASGATLTGGTNITVYVTGESAGETNAPPDGYAVNLDGTISGELSFNLTTPATTLMDLVPSSGNVHNLTINHSSFIGTFLGDTSIAGNLTITAGELKSAGSNSLTVTGDCIVEGTLTGNASAISIGSLRVDGTYSATSGTTIITSERSNGRAIDIVGTYTHNSGTLEIQTPADTDLRCPSSSSLNNLTINHASCIARPTGDNKPPIAGDLTITAGTFNTLDSDGSSNHALTVTGATTIGDGSSSADTATLTCNASTISLGSGVTGTHSLVVQAGGTFTGGTGTHTLGSLNIKNSTAAKCTLSSGNTTINGEGSANKAINIEGSNGTTNFAHGSGTVIITHDGASDIKADGVTLALNNLTINHASANINLKGNLSVAGNLTITAGELDTDSSDFALTVTGDASVTGTLTGNASAISLGSLTINSGGTYSATSGTTTLTNQTGGGFAWYNAGGTFTHNDGLVKFTDNASLYCQENTFYDLELNLTSVTLEFRWSDISGNTLNILNDFTISSGRFKFNTAGDGIIVHGLTKLKSTSQFGLNSPSGVHTFNGLVTINGGTWNLSSGTNNMSGIRNVGGTIA